MNGTAPSAGSKWYTEPLRKIANGLAWTVAALGAGIAVANELTGFGFVPDNIRTDITVGVSIATAAVVILQKVQGELGRNGVPGTTFNGMLSPQTAHNAMVASAQPATPLVTTGGRVVQTTPTVDAVGAALGQDIDGNHVAEPSIPQPPQPVAQPDLSQPEDGGRQ